MTKIFKIFTDHPASVGESYFEHMAMAFGFGSKMLIAGIACLLHGIFPFMCLKTGSTAVNSLHEQMVTHRDKRPETECSESTSPEAT